MRALKALLVSLSMLLLGGCFTFDMDMQVTSDDTVTGTMVLAVDKSMAGMLGNVTDTIDLQSGAGLPDGVVAEPYEKDGRVGQKLTFTDVPLAEMNTGQQDEAGGFTLERDGDTFVFTIEFDPSKAGSDGSDTSAGTPNGQFDDAMKQMMKTASCTVAMTFPGQILETNGEVDGTTVTWDVDMTQPLMLTATALAVEGATSTAKPGAEADGSGAPALDAAAESKDSEFPVLPIVIGAVVLVAIAVGAVVLTNRRRGPGIPTG